MKTTRRGFLGGLFGAVAVGAAVKAAARPEHEVRAEALFTEYFADGQGLVVTDIDRKAKTITVGGGGMDAWMPDDVTFFGVDRSPTYASYKNASIAEKIAHIELMLEQGLIDEQAARKLLDFE